MQVWIDGLNGTRLSSCHRGPTCRPPASLELTANASLQVERSEDGAEAEIGFFAVDPDLQGSGIGKRLLLRAERHAAATMGSRVAVLWVISSRADLLGWYARMGYATTDRTAPFPVEANVGVPRPGTAIAFVRLEKAISPESASGWDALTRA